MFRNYVSIFLLYLVGVTVSEVEVKERTEEGTSTKIAKGITVGKEYRKKRKKKVTNKFTCTSNAQ